MIKTLPVFFPRHRESTLSLTGFHKEDRAVTQEITNLSNNNSRPSQQNGIDKVSGRGRGVLGLSSSQSGREPAAPKVGMAASFDSLYILCLVITKLLSQIVMEDTD